MQSAVFHPKRFGQDGPTMGAMMNTNMLFGMRAFDLCEMLENIAPNVRELQLFRDDIAEIHMDRKCPFIFFPVVSILFYITSIRGRRLFPP